jgi:1,4-alpha-glucan branching enzyme
MSNDHSSDSLESASPSSPLFDDQQLERFQHGEHFAIYELLGAHPTRELWDGDEVEGTRFAVWAPNASRVSVIGDFNSWDGDVHVMGYPDVARGSHSGIWTVFVPGAHAGQLYQYQLHGPEGERVPNKADPVAFSAEVAPKRASRICAPLTYNWGDQTWINERGAKHQLNQAMSIYELHLGSWSGRGWLNYREIADELIPYVSALGFTHIELMPITEYPFDGSWGYQTLGLFAPTSRYGSPEDLCAFIDRCHQANIGVILDWVPGHFPVDEHGLARFDGTCLYEHSDPRQGMHPDWGTCLYQYGRYEVRDFLISSAVFWLERFHFDGLRVDAVASMLYLDYSRNEGEWIPNNEGGNTHFEAVDFLKLLNEEVYRRFPGILMIAEESTAWPGVSAPTYDGGLGFGRKWNMGWMNDTLRYIEDDPVHRKYNHHLVTFGLIYQYSERFILPISHDEVVHGKKSLISKMPGDEWQRFAHLRLYLSFMWTHPGQKLLFMGSELAQADEWSPERGLAWGGFDQEDLWIDGHEGPWHWRSLLGTPHTELSEPERQHQPHERRRLGLWLLLRRLNSIYRELTALHQRDMDPSGFHWILADDADRSLVSYLRVASDQCVVVALNFTPVPRSGELVGVPETSGGSEWEVVLNSDERCYAGSGVGPERGSEIHSKPNVYQGQPHTLCFDIPPLGVVVLKNDGGIAQ